MTTTWETEEVARIISNEEGLYTAWNNNVGINDMRQWINIVTDNSNADRINWLRVDWDEVDTLI